MVLSESEVFVILIAIGDFYMSICNYFMKLKIFKENYRYNILLISDRVYIYISHRRKYFWEKLKGLTVKYGESG